MGKPKRKGRSLVHNNPQPDFESTSEIGAPHSFVLHRGLSCPYVWDLTLDFRRILEPNTASSLRERKNVKIKDFVSVSGIFHVSHLCIFNKTKTQLSFKIARLPRGPTLSFKVHQFTLARDVISSFKKQYVEEDSFRHPPLVILNNFTGDGKHLKLMSTTFQNLFPTVNLATVKLSTIKRCVLISYNPVTKLTDLRHFTITVAPVGLNRGIKKVVLGKIPNMGNCDDIADFIANEAAADSDYEDDAGQVILPQTLKSRGNIEDNKSAIKLHEIGPRLTIELSKIEEGLFTGGVLYHQTIVKTEEEEARILEERAQKKKLKEERKRIQQQNALKKSKLKDELKHKSLHGMSKKLDENVDDKEDQSDYEEKNDEVDDDDAAYYKDEIGEEPDKDLFTGTESRKRPFVPKYIQRKSAKKPKLDERGNKNKKNKKGLSNAKADSSDKKMKGNMRFIPANAKKKKFRKHNE